MKSKIANLMHQGIGDFTSVSRDVMTPWWGGSRGGLLAMSSRAPGAAQLPGLQDSLT